MNSRYLVYALIAIVLVGGAFYLASTSFDLQNFFPTNRQEPVGGGPGNIISPSEIKEFDVKGMLVLDQTTGQKMPRFDKEEIRVKEGDRVRINFENTEGLHDWNIDEFDARTRQIQVGQRDTVEFLADKKGTFEYYCSVPSHRENGMVGSLTVE